MLGLFLLVYQKPLFYTPPQEPEGFTYKPEFLSMQEETDLLHIFSTIELTAYIHEEYEAKRRIKSYAKQTGYPSFLEPFIEKAAGYAKVEVHAIEHAMITEYSPGTQIGWHRDMPPYEKIIGISLGSAVPFRFRRHHDEAWERITYTAEPRSIYSMEGPARYVWQHSIPPVEELRYSITMRTVQI
jgi:alkylated DNA repair dioxygenase AlkB